MTPNRPEATCLIELRRIRRSHGKRSSSSPPSPVFERPPMRFIAIASVSCASLLMEPYDIAPVAKRLTISLAGSTSSIGIGFADVSERHQAAQRAQLPGSARRPARVYSLKVAKLCLLDRMLQFADRRADSAGGYSPRMRY